METSIHVFIIICRTIASRANEAADRLEMGDYAGANTALEAVRAILNHFSLGEMVK